MPQVPVAGNPRGCAPQFLPGTAGIARDQCIAQGVDDRRLAAVQKQVSLTAFRRSIPVDQQFVQQRIGGRDQFAACTVAQAMVGNPFGNQPEAEGKGPGRFQDIPGEPRVVDRFVEAGNLPVSPGSKAFFGELPFAFSNSMGEYSRWAWSN